MNPMVEALAERLKAALDEHEAGRRRDQAAREEELAEARAARGALLEELAAFGRKVGHMNVDAHPDRVAFTRGNHLVAFVPEGEADVLRVELGSLTGAPAGASPVRICRAQDPQKTWVLAVAHDGVEDVEPLIETGLVHLLVEGLALPLPRPERKAQPPLDDLVPRGDG